MATNSLSQITARRRAALATVFFIAVAGTVTLSSTAATNDPAQPMVQLPSFRTLIAKNVGAVVSVHARQAQTATRRQAPQLPEGIPEQFRRFFEQAPGMPRNQPSASQGSGFIISEDGYILTNAHVVGNADSVEVRLNDNRELAAELVGSDERSDVALLKVDATGLQAVKLGDSQALQVGDWVLAIGSPFGFDYSVSQGIVSAKARSLPDGTYVPFIQTDVAVNPGNSGGPLFDLNGQVVGINSQIYSRSGGYQGVSFAIPIKLAMNIVDQIKSNGSVSRGWLGVGIQNVDQDLADSFGLDKPAGAAVTQIMAGSPAANAGVKVGDVIVRFNGEEVVRSSALPPLVGRTRVGSTVTMDVLRDGRSVSLDVTIAKLDDSRIAANAKLPAPTDNETKLGVAVADLTPRQREELNISHGVLINAVEPDSPAAEAGLRGGDVILSFNRADVKSVKELSELISESDDQRPYVLLVKREDRTLFVPLRAG